MLLVPSFVLSICRSSKPTVWSVVRDVFSISFSLLLLLSQSLHSPQFHPGTIREPSYSSFPFFFLYDQSPYFPSFVVHTYADDISGWLTISIFFLISCHGSRYSIAVIDYALMLVNNKCIQTILRSANFWTKHPDCTLQDVQTCSPICHFMLLLFPGILNEFEGEAFRYYGQISETAGTLLGTKNDIPEECIIKKHFGVCDRFSNDSLFKRNPLSRFTWSVRFACKSTCKNISVPYLGILPGVNRA